MIDVIPQNFRYPWRWRDRERSGPSCARAPRLFQVIHLRQHPEEYLPWLRAQLKLDPRAVKLALGQKDDIWDNNPAFDPYALLETQKIEVEYGNQKKSVGSIRSPTFVSSRRST
jgi:hypothetical protein